MSIFSLPKAFPVEDLLRASSLIKPSSPGDILALTAITLGSISYLLKGITWDKKDPHYYKFFERPHLSDYSISNAKKETRNIAEKLAETGKNLVILWGSQSGTAEGFAQRLGRECHLRFGLEVILADLSDYDAETIALIPEDKFAIFIVSTYGEGDPSDNTAGLWNWLHKSKHTSLSRLRYVAFGLGNSNYKYYNRVIDVIAQTLDKFGAKALVPIGRADDAQGATEEDFIAWRENLFSVFRQDFGFQEKEIEYMPTFSVVKDDSLEPIDLHHGEPVHSREKVKTAAACSPIRAFNIKTSRELFNSSDRNCLHIDLDLANHPDLHYKTGDYLGVWPMNPDEEVNHLLDALGSTAEQDVPITIKSLDPDVKIKIPTPTTTKALLQHYFEIYAPISRENILSLVQFAPSAEAKAYLTAIGKDKNVYSDFSSSSYSTLGQVLSLSSPSVPWATLPLSHLIETLPHIQPRYYSISSSSVVSPRQPSITALVAKSPLANNAQENIFGETTNYLLALSNSLNAATQTQSLTYNPAGPSNALQGTKLFAHIRKPKFKLPTLSICPLTMVAVGTGLAPHLAFLSERRKLFEIGRPVGKMVLFFGCRNPEEDFIYRKEIGELERGFKGKLKVVMAFSRAERKKVYVQERVGECGQEVLELLEEGANLYICGRAGMAKDVERTLGEVVKVGEGVG